MFHPFPILVIMRSSALHEDWILSSAQSLSNMNGKSIELLLHRILIKLHLVFF